MTIKENNQTEVYETVCGGVLKNPSRFPSSVYQGKRVYFCMVACLEVFENDPDRFMTGEIEHPKPSASKDKT